MSKAPKRIKPQKSVTHCLIEEYRRVSRELEEYRSALIVIHTWAKFRNGEALIPEDVERLTRKTLKITK
jgi:RecA-family ATPase